MSRTIASRLLRPALGVPALLPTACRATPSVWAATSSLPTTSCTASPAWTSAPESNAAARSFSQTALRATKTIQATRIPDFFIPPYPYGENRVYKQSNRGLYGGGRVSYGEQISGKRGTKTPRRWKVNVQRKRLWSDSLGVWVKTKLSMRVLRTLRHEGGLDAYLLKSKTSRIRELGPSGWRLRWLVLQTPAVQERFARERAELLARVTRLAVVDGDAAAAAQALQEAAAATTSSVDGGEEGALEQMQRRSLEHLHITLDHATPGPLSRRTRDLLAKIAQEKVAEEHFVLGDEDADAEAEGEGEGEAETAEAEPAQNESDMDYEFETISIPRETEGGADKRP